MQKNTTFSKVIYNISNPTCVVFDLDATLCHHGEQSGFDKCDEFEPIAAVVEVAKNCKSMGFDLVIATARPDIYAEGTGYWLQQHLPEFDALYMKNSDDDSTGSQCKGDQLMDILRFWDDIKFWVDDSPFNAQVIRDHGVDCIRPSHNDAFWADYGDK
jgi:hypothetical protein